MKPDTHTAMQALIQQVRQAIPFDLPVARLCAGPCTGCSKKLLEFLDMELEEWEQRLNRGEAPTFGDIQRLAKRSKKIHGVLQRNGLLDAQG